MDGIGGGDMPCLASLCLFLASLILGSASVHIVDPGIQSGNGENIVGISGNEPAYSGVNVKTKLKYASNVIIGLQQGNSLTTLPESQNGRNNVGADIAIASYSADSLNMNDRKQLSNREQQITKDQASPIGPKNDHSPGLKISNQALKQDGVQSQVHGDNPGTSPAQLSDSNKNNQPAKRFAKSNKGSSPPSNTHEHHLGNRNDIRPNDAPPTDNRLSVGNNGIRQRLPENIQHSDRRPFSLDENGNGIPRNFDQRTSWSTNDFVGTNDRQLSDRNRQDVSSSSRFINEGARRNDVRPDQRNGNDLRLNAWSENDAQHQNQIPFQNRDGNDFRSNARTSNTAIDNRNANNFQSNIRWATNVETLGNEELVNNRNVNDFRSNSLPENRIFRQDNRNVNDFNSNSRSRNDMSQRREMLNENRNGNNFRRNFQNDVQLVNRNENEFLSLHRSAHDAPSDTGNRNPPQQDPWASPNNNNGHARNGFNQDNNGRVHSGTRSDPRSAATPEVGRHPSEVRRHDPAGRRWDEQRSENTGSSGNNGWMDNRAQNSNRNINTNLQGGQEFNDRRGNNGDRRFQALDNIVNVDNVQRFGDSGTNNAHTNSQNNGPITNGIRNDIQRVTSDGFQNRQNDHRWDSGSMNGIHGANNMRNGLNSIHDARGPNQDPFLDENRFRNGYFREQWDRNDSFNQRSNTNNANVRTRNWRNGVDNIPNDQQTGWNDHPLVQNTGRGNSFHDPSTNAGSMGHFRRNDVNDMGHLLQNINGDGLGMDNMNWVRSPHERSWNIDNSRHNIRGGTDNRFMPADGNSGWQRNGGAVGWRNGNTGPFQNGQRIPENNRRAQSFGLIDPTMNGHRGNRQQHTIVVNMLPTKPLTPAPPIGLDLNSLLLRMALEDVLPDIDFPPRVRSVTQPEPVSTVGGVTEAPIQTTPGVTQASAQSMLSVPQQPLPKKTVPEQTLTKVTVPEAPVKRAIPYDLKQSSIPQRKNRKLNEMTSDITTIEKIIIEPSLKTKAIQYIIAENKLPNNLQATASKDLVQPDHKPVRRTRQRVTEAVTPSVEGTAGASGQSIPNVNTKVETAIVIEPLGNSDPVAYVAIPIAIEPAAVAEPTSRIEIPVIVEPLVGKTLNVNEVVVDAMAIGVPSKLVIDPVAKESAPVTTLPVPIFVESSIVIPANANPIASIPITEPISVMEMPTVIGLAEGGNPTKVIDIPIVIEPVAETVVKSNVVVDTPIVGVPRIVVVDPIISESLPVTAVPVTVKSSTETPPNIIHIVSIPLAEPTLAREIPSVIGVAEGGSITKSVDIPIIIEPVSATISQPAKVIAEPVFIENVAAVKATNANENPIVVDHLSVIKAVNISDNQLTIAPEIVTTGSNNIELPTGLASAMTSTPLPTSVKYTSITDRSTPDTKTMDPSYAASNLSLSEIAIDNQLNNTMILTSATETVPGTNISLTDYSVVTTIGPTLQTTPSDILSNLTAPTSTNISVDTYIISLSGNDNDTNLFWGDNTTSTTSQNNASSIAQDLGMITVIDNSTGNDTAVADAVTNTNSSLTVDDTNNATYATFADSTFNNDTTLNFTIDLKTDQGLSVTTKSQINSVKITGASLYESVSVLKPDPQGIGFVHKSKSNAVIPTTPQKQTLSVDLQKLQENKLKSVRNGIQNFIRNRLTNAMQPGTASSDLATKKQNVATSYGNGKSPTKKLSGSILDYPKTDQQRVSSGQRVTTKLSKNPVKLDRAAVLNRRLSTHMATFLKNSNFASTTNKIVKTNIFHGFHTKNGNLIPLATFTPKTKKNDVGLRRQPFVDMPHIPARAADKSKILNVLNRAHGTQTIAATQPQDYGMNAGHYDLMNMMHMHQMSKLMAADRPERPEYEPIEPIEFSLPEVVRPSLPSTSKGNIPLPELSTVNPKITTLNNVSSQYILKSIPQQHHIVSVSVSQYPDAVRNAQRAPKIDKKTVVVNARKPPSRTLYTANTLRVNQTPDKPGTQQVGTQRAAAVSRARLSVPANQLYPAVKGHPSSGSNAAPIVVNNTGSVPSWPSEYIVFSDRVAGTNGPTTKQIATGASNSGPRATGSTGAVKATPKINNVASTRAGNQAAKARTTFPAAHAQTVSRVNSMGLYGPNNGVFSARRRTSALTKQSTGRANTDALRQSKTTTGSLTLQQPRTKSIAYGQITSKNARNMGSKTGETRFVVANPVANVLGSPKQGTTRVGATVTLVQDIVGKRVTGTKHVGKTIVGGSRQKAHSTTGTKTAGFIINKNANPLKRMHATYGNKAKSTAVSPGFTIGGLQRRNKAGTVLTGSVTQGKVGGAALGATKKNVAGTIGHAAVGTVGVRAQSNTASLKLDNAGVHAIGRLAYGTAGAGVQGRRGNIGTAASHSNIGATGHFSAGGNVAGSYAVQSNSATAGTDGTIIRTGAVRIMSRTDIGANGYNGNIGNGDPGYAVYGSIGTSVSNGNGAAVLKYSGVTAGQGRSRNRSGIYAAPGNAAATGTATNGAGYYPTHSNTGAAGSHGTSGNGAAVHGTRAKAGGSAANGGNAGALRNAANGLTGSTAPWAHGSTGPGARGSKARGSTGAALARGISGAMATGHHAQEQTVTRVSGSSAYVTAGSGITGPSGKTEITRVGQINTGTGITGGHGTVKTGSITLGVHGITGVGAAGIVHPGNTVIGATGGNINVNAQTGSIMQAAYGNAHMGAPIANGNIQTGSITPAVYGEPGVVATGSVHQAYADTGTTERHGSGNFGSITKAVHGNVGVGAAGRLHHDNAGVGATRGYGNVNTGRITQSLHGNAGGNGNVNVKTASLTHAVHGNTPPGVAGDPGSRSITHPLQSNAGVDAALTAVYGNTGIGASAYVPHWSTGTGIGGSAVYGTERSTATHGAEMMHGTSGVSVTGNSGNTGAVNARNVAHGGSTRPVYQSNAGPQTAGNAHRGVAGVGVGEIGSQIQSGASVAGIGAHGGLGPHATNHVPHSNAGVGAYGAAAYGASGASPTGTVSHGNTGAYGGPTMGVVHADPGGAITGNYGKIGTGNARNAAHGDSIRSFIHGNAGAHAAVSIHHGVAEMGVARTGSQIQTSATVVGIGANGGLVPHTARPVSQTNAGVGASGAAAYASSRVNPADTISHGNTGVYGGPAFQATSGIPGGSAINGNYGNIGTGNAGNAAHGGSTGSVTHGNAGVHGNAGSHGSAGSHAAGSVHHGVTGMGVSGIGSQIQTGASAVGIDGNGGFGLHDARQVSQSNYGVGASGVAAYGSSRVNPAGTILHDITGAQRNPTYGAMNGRPGGAITGNYGNIGIGKAGNAAHSGSTGSVTHGNAGDHAAGSGHYGVPGTGATGTGRQIQTDVTAVGIGANGGLGPHIAIHGSQGGVGASGVNPAGTISHGNTGAYGGPTLQSMNGIAGGGAITGNYGNIGTGNARNFANGGSIGYVTHGNAGSHAAGSVHHGVTGMGVSGIGSQIQTGASSVGIDGNGGLGLHDARQVSQSNYGVGASGVAAYGSSRVNPAGTILHDITGAQRNPTYGAMNGRPGGAITGNYGNIGIGKAGNAAHGGSTGSVTHGNAGDHAAGSGHYGVPGTGATGTGRQIQTDVTAVGIGANGGLGPHIAIHGSQGGVGASGVNPAGTISHGNTGAYGGPTLQSINGIAGGGAITGNYGNIGTGNARNFANGGSIGYVTHGSAGSHAAGNIHHGVAGMGVGANAGGIGSHGGLGTHAASHVAHSNAGVGVSGVGAYGVSGAIHHSITGARGVAPLVQTAIGPAVKNNAITYPIGIPRYGTVTTGNVGSGGLAGVQTGTKTAVTTGGAGHGNHPGSKMTGSLGQRTIGSNVMGATLTGHSSPVAGALGSRSYGNAVSGAVGSSAYTNAATGGGGDLAYGVGQAGLSAPGNTGNVAIGNIGAAGYSPYGTTGIANAVGSTGRGIPNNAGRTGQATFSGTGSIATGTQTAPAPGNPVQPPIGTFGYENTGAGWATEYGTGQQGNAAASASVHAIRPSGRVKMSAVAGGIHQAAGQSGLGLTDMGAIWGAQYGHAVSGSKTASGQLAIGTGNTHNWVPNKLPGMTKATRPAQSNRNVGGMVPLITPIRSKLGGGQQVVASSGNQGVGGALVSSVNNVRAGMVMQPQAQASAFGIGESNIATQHGQQAANAAQHRHAGPSAKQAPGHVGFASGTHVPITIHAGTGIGGHPRPLLVTTNLDATQNVRRHRLTGSTRGMQTGTLHSRGGTQMSQGHGPRTGATRPQAGARTPNRMLSRTRGRPSKSRISSGHVNSATMSRSHPRVESIVLSRPKLLVVGPTLLKPVHTVHKVRTVHKVLSPTHSLNRITGIRYKKPGLVRAHSILPIKVVPILNGKVLPKLKRKPLYLGVGAKLHMKSSRYLLF